MYACHYIKSTGQFPDPSSCLRRPVSHCNMQMCWEGWLTRQPDGNWLFHRFHMGVAASEGDMSAMQTARSRIED